MKIHEKLMSSIRSRSPYLEWAAAGRTSEDVKADILVVLRPHFENPSVLTDLPLSVLAHEAVTIANIQANPWALSMFAGVLSEYRDALAQDRPESLLAAEAWDEPILRAMSEFMSLCIMEVDNADLQLDEFRLETLRTIGGLLEACVQPQLKAILHQVRIRRRRKAHVAELQSLKFGAAVEELYQALRAPAIVAPPPWNIKLHHWRNIAQHHSAIVQDGRIVCQYLVGKAVYQVALTRTELLGVAHTMQQVLSIVRAARSVFIADNRTAFSGRRPLEPRPEISFFQFAVGLATQGFNIVAVAISDDCAHLHVQDATNHNPLHRGVHASQFLVGTWVHYPRPLVRVTYIDKSGRKCLEASVPGSDCEAVADERVPLETLADRVSFRVVDEVPKCGA